MREFNTENIDLVAFLSVKGFTPHPCRNEPGNKALFCFEESPDLLAAVVDYVQDAVAPAKRLLGIRGHLYKVAGRVVREGR